ncbi:MAG: ribosome biogenesis GTPase Der [Phycisphaerae bacterium]|nr:ribosome biogenesis GTPase Der [Phycisphaerae bacterium]
MSLPIVTIVGRPNVGKSSLFNRLAGRRIAIVDPTPGVTRDRVSFPLALDDREDGRYAELVDTGGMGIEDSDDLTAEVEDQIAYALSAASLIVFVVDAREGILPLDRTVARRLRRQDTPVLLVANKVDHPDQISELYEMSELGFGEALGVSAAHGLGADDLLDAIRSHLGDAGERPDEAVMKLAVVGKRNAGKSTLINALAGGPRVIVSETPGTTRDSVDVTVESDDQRITLIDTAGVRKKKKLAGDVEFYSYSRAMQSIRRADVVALMIDAAVPVSQVDKKLAAEIAKQERPVAFVVNKWDLAGQSATGEDYAEYLAKTFPSLSFAPVSLTQADAGVNVRETIHLTRQLYDQARTRVGTGRLNAALEDILAQRGPSHKRGTRPPKLYYAAQVATAPPTIVCFVNDVRSFDEGYRRFLLNQLREHLPFAEVPIRLLFRPRRNDDAR